MKGLAVSLAWNAAAGWWEVLPSIAEGSKEQLFLDLDGFPSEHARVRVDGQTVTVRIFRHAVGAWAYAAELPGDLTP